MKKTLILFLMVMNVFNANAVDFQADPRDRLDESHQTERYPSINYYDRNGNRAVAQYVGTEASCEAAGGNESRNVNGYCLVCNAGSPAGYCEDVFSNNYVRRYRIAGTNERIVRYCRPNNGQLSWCEENVFGPFERSLREQSDYPGVAVEISAGVEYRSGLEAPVVAMLLGLNIPIIPVGCSYIGTNLGGRIGAIAGELEERELVADENQSEINNVIVEAHAGVNAMFFNCDQRGSRNLRGMLAVEATVGYDGHNDLLGEIEERRDTGHGGAMWGVRLRGQYNFGQNGGLSVGGWIGISQDSRRDADNDVDLTLGATIGGTIPGI